MAIDWKELDKTLFPLKGYEDLCRRLGESFSFTFVREVFNFKMPALTEYVQLSVGGDLQDRYKEYAALLHTVFTRLDGVNVKDMLDLKTRVEKPAALEALLDQSGLSIHEAGNGLKFLIYWFIPGSKYLSGLVRLESARTSEIALLRAAGIRTNLEILEAGRTPAGREDLAAKTELEGEIILEWVNRADLSRMPWASKATISNIMGAGYSSLAALANAEPQKLYADFYAYGRSIGKNFKFGNEIDNCQRIAKILPAILT